MSSFLIERSRGDSLVTAEIAFRLAAAYPQRVPDPHELVERWGMHRATAYRWIRAMKEARGMLVDDEEVGMTGTEVMCGDIRKRSSRFVAERAAMAIVSFKSPRAVCVDPQGRLTVESPGSACEYDLMSVWSPDVGVKALTAALIDEIEDELVRRGWINKVEAQRSRKAA